jgi:hypothetical protein
VRWAFGVYRHTFVQGRSGTLSCFFVFVNHLVFFYFEAINSSNQAPRVHFRGAVLKRHPLAREAHLTVSFLAVNPLRIFIFEVLATRRISFFAARFSTGARCEGGAYYS